MTGLFLFGYGVAALGLEGSANGGEWAIRDALKSDRASAEKARVEGDLRTEEIWG